MEFQKISSPSLRDLFIEQLEHLILSGKLQVGEKLPPERQLAEMMQVSRAVVNSGISELEKKGFLTVKPRSGTYVADFRRKGTLDTLIAIMNYNGGRMRRRFVPSSKSALRLIHLLHSSLSTRSATKTSSVSSNSLIRSVMHRMSPLPLKLLTNSNTSLP